MSKVNASAEADFYPIIETTSQIKSEKKHADNKGRLHILYVDDDLRVLEVTKQILEMDANFEVDTVTSVDEAFSKLATQPYDAIISDFEMPTKNGLDFLKDLREQKNEIPFALFTGKGREEVAIKALKNGADGYYNKQGSTETVYGELSHGIRLVVERRRTKADLMESEKRYRTLMEHAAEIILVHDIKGRIIDANQQACKSLGYTKEELLSMTIADIDPEVTENKKGGLVWPKVIAGQNAAFESSQKRKDGSTFPIEVTLNPLALNKEALVISLAQDISERKRMREEVKSLLSKAEESAKEWQLTFDSASDVIALISPDFEFLRVNKVGCELTGKKPEELVGKKCYEVVHGLDAPIAGCPCAETLKTKKAGSGEVTQSGRTFIATASPVMDENNELVAFVHTIKDITERKQAEENLKSLKAFDERIIDSLGDALLLIDPDDYKIINVNQTALKQLNLRKEDLIGKTCYEMTHGRSTPCQPPNDTCPIREVLETGKPVTVEHNHFDGNNNERVVEVSARPVRNPDGKTVIIHVAKDITERKQMETKIHETEKRYRALFNQAPLGVLIVDPETATPVEFNEAVHQQLGYSREEFAKLRIYDYEAFEDSVETNAKMEKILREGRDEWETKHRTKTGEIRDVMITAQAIELSGKTFLQSIYRDVTESKKVEAALMQSETKYRMLVELAQEGVWALDAENCIVFANPRMAEMLGYSINEMVGNNFSAFIGEMDIDVALHNLEGCKLGKQGQCEFEFIRKDGTRIYASVAASSIKNDEGNSIGTIALVADITERKKAEEELKRSLDKLELMNEKMHVVGSLTRHDVRNKLLAVPGYAYLLKQKHADQADIVNGLGKMEQAVKEIEKIFEFAKIYEELGAEELTYLDVEKAVNEATELFSGLTIEVVNDCHGLTVLADSFLRQLFYNFIDNTRKYGKTTTTIRVYSEKEGIGDLKLVYEDNGVGISTENKLQLFRKGFSTGGSTGFGLFLIKKMIDAYGWEIQENGEPGKGAKFIMTIPKLNKNGKDSFQIAAKHDSKQTLERDILSVHISNSEENYTLSSNNDVAPVLSEKGGNDIANQRINR